MVHPFTPHCLRQHRRLVSHHQIGDARFVIVEHHTFGAVLGDLGAVFGRRDFAGNKRPEVLFRERIYRVGLHIADHHNDGIVGTIPALIPGAQIGRRHVFNVRFPTDNRIAVRAGKESDRLGSFRCERLG